jgi:cysteine synthase
MAKVYTSADQLIGKTPLLELTHIEQEYGLKAKVLAKLEYFNPAGSVKDRVAKAILDDAEATGKTVYAGPTEATAIGNLTAQMITAGELADLQEARKCIFESFEIRKFVDK